MLATHALALVGVPMKRVIRMVQAQRHQRYELLRSEDFADDHDHDHDDANANANAKPLGKTGPRKDA